MNFYVEADTFGTWRGDVEVTKEEEVIPTQPTPQIVKPKRSDKKK